MIGPMKTNISFEVFTEIANGDTLAEHNKAIIVENNLIPSLIVNNCLQ